MMESQTEIERLKQSLGLSFKLAWIFGVPNVQVRYVLRVIDAAILILIVTVGYLYFLVWIINEKTFVVALNIRTLYIVAQAIVAVSVHSTIINWVVRGAEMVRKTVLSLNEVDKVLKVEQTAYRLLDSHFRNHFWSMRLQILLCFALLFSDSRALQINIGNDLSNFLRKISYVIMYTVRRSQLLVFNILFCVVIRAIHLRFLYINCTLYEMARALNDDIPSSVQRFYTNEKGKTIFRPVIRRIEGIIAEIEVLHRTHKRLRDITDNFTEAFWPCLFSFRLSVLFLSIFYILVVVVRDLKISNDWYATAINDIAQCTETIAEYWLVMSTCENLSDEANKFARMLHIIDHTDPAFQRQLQELSINHSQNKVTVTAGGLFVLGVSQFISVLSSLLGYTIIAYQLN